jgi:hypothetical protein
MGNELFAQLYSHHGKSENSVPTETHFQQTQNENEEENKADLTLTVTRVNCWNRTRNP